MDLAAATPVSVCAGSSRWMPRALSLAHSTRWRRRVRSDAKWWRKRSKILVLTLRKFSLSWSNFRLVEKIPMDLKLPKLGEGADSGVVVTVFVKEGDTIAKDQSVIELENEKAVASIPATDGGVVSKVYVKVGDKISAGQRILT